MKTKLSIICALTPMFLWLNAHSVSAQQISGVGVAVAASTNGFKVIGVMPGSPAEASGRIHPGDRIIAVAQGDEPPMSTSGLGLAQLVDFIRGPEHSVVRLTVVPAGETDASGVEVRMQRMAIKVPTVPPNARNAPRPKPGFWASLPITWNTLVLIVAVPIVLIFGYRWLRGSNR